MSIDWKKVTVDHVRQACELFEVSAAVPKRPAKNTFLFFNGKTYPAKFIRGLAYRIATGVELDPSKDFSGGDQTARFFANLGLVTSSGSAPSALATPASSTSTATPSVPDPGATNLASPRNFEPQKMALLDLLKNQFGTVECEAEFPWLVVPKADELSEPLLSIYQALQAMRGFSNFAGAGRALRCDFYIPHARLLVEYDERQHFTLQRGKSLELYPADITLGFDRQDWIKTCNSIKATDPNPPYRDEQRAFYDSLRDILAAQHAYRLVRYRHREFDWTSQEAKGKLASAISDPVLLPPRQSERSSAQVPRSRRSP